jgi:hypothetical protein
MDLEVFGVAEPAAGLPRLSPLPLYVSRAPASAKIWLAVPPLQSKLAVANKLWTFGRAGKRLKLLPGILN